MPASTANHYETLGVSRDFSFGELKKAYWRRAKETHPDLNHGSRHSEEEFKRVVQAFDVLSDRRRRRIYDAGLAAGEATKMQAGISFADDGPSIMDSLADDILEEMVVGNEPPKTATLQTLMLDLASTRIFISFREAKSHFNQNQFRAAMKICQRLVRSCPHNILHHYYLAESARRINRRHLARKHFRTCLAIGLMRIPPQRLELVYQRLDQLNQESGLLGKFYRWILPAPPPGNRPMQEELDRELNQAVRKMLNSEEKKEGKSKKAGGKKPKPPSPQLKA